MADLQYDVLVIGGGQAGVPLAQTLAGSGRRVALAERRHLGGSCVNFGCTPTKAALASARLAHRARRAADFGLRIPTVEVDFPAVIARARDLSRSFREGLNQGFDGDNPALLRGHARFEGRTDGGFRLRVGDREVTAARVVVNTGTRSRRPSAEGVETVPLVHAGNWLGLDTLPEHLVLLGGGYIGVEMGQFYRRMGARVTIVDARDRVLGREDGEVSEALRGVLEREGVVFRLGATLARVEGGAPIRLHLDRDGTRETLEASHLFAAIGRVPNTDDLGLDVVGVARDEEGYLVVDEHLATNVDGIYAAGDVRGGPMFTHTSWDDHRILLATLTGEGDRTTDRVVPYAVHTDPSLGRVGLTEAQAREAGYDVETAWLDVATNGKAQEEGEGEGFVKLVVDAATDRLLGAAAFAGEGAEIIHACVALMNADAPWRRLYDGVFAHPTYSEAVHSAFGEL